MTTHVPMVTKSVKFLRREFILFLTIKIFLINNFKYMRNKIFLKSLNQSMIFGYMRATSDFFKLTFFLEKYLVHPELVRM